MFFFRRRGVVQEVQNQIQQVLLHSFGQVRHDVQNVYEWLRFLHNQNQQQQRIIEDLKQQIMFMPKNKEEIKELIDNYYALEPVIERIHKIEEKLTQVEHVKQQVENLKQQSSHSEIIAKSNSEVVAKLHEITARMESLPRTVEKPAQRQSTTSNLQDKIIRNVARNSKDYIKGILLKSIQKYEKISGLQLREMLVEEQGLVSRSSFYRLLAELEAESKVKVVPEGKEKIYMSVNSQTLTV